MFDHEPNLNVTNRVDGELTIEYETEVEYQISPALLQAIEAVTD